MPLRKLLLFAVTVGALVMFLASPAFAGLTRAEIALLKVINATRAHYGLGPLRIDPRLERAARAHSKDMLRRHYFDHGSFATRMERYRVRGQVIGENIAWWPGRRSAAQVVVRMWLHSSMHRANLLRPGYNRIGVAALRGKFSGSKVRMITADFAGG